MYYVSALSVPDCEEFTSTFGADCEINEEYVQTCVLQDKFLNKIKISNGLLDGSFRIIYTSNEEVIIDMYEEKLVSVVLDGWGNLIELKLFNEDNSHRMINVKVWDNISIISSCI